MALKLKNDVKSVAPIPLVPTPAFIPPALKQVPAINKLSWNTEPYKIFVSQIDREKLRKQFDILAKKLKLDEQRQSREALIEAIDYAADYFFMACELALIAKNEKEKFSLYYDIEMAKLNDKAQDALEEMKAKKEMTSQITIDRKRQWIVENEIEKFKELEETRRELTVIEERFNNLKEAWRLRSSLVQSQARAIQEKVQVNLAQQI